MKLKLLAFVAIGASLSSLNAATVTGITFDFSAAPAVSSGVTIDGIAVAASAGISANTGWFNDGFDVSLAVTNSDWTGILTNFNLTSAAVVGATAGLYGADYAGLYDTGQGALAASALDPAIGNSLYTLFGTGSDVLGLVDSGQVVAVDAFPPTDYTLSPATGTILVGKLSSGTFSADNLGIFGQTAASIDLVPEPSAALLGALGALGLLRRRRI